MKCPTGYCLFCGEPLNPADIETMTNNMVWRCPKERCQGSKIEVKTDPHGFVVLPIQYAGRYIYSKARV